MIYGDAFYVKSKEGSDIKQMQQNFPKSLLLMANMILEMHFKPKQKALYQSFLGGNAPRCPLSKCCNKQKEKFLVLCFQ